MNYYEIAFNLINEWQAGNYLNQTQKKANLQCRIIEALEGVAFSCKSQSAGSVVDGCWNCEYEGCGSPCDKCNGLSDWEPQN